MKIASILTALVCLCAVAGDQIEVAGKSSVGNEEVALKYGIAFWAQDKDDAGDGQVIKVVLTSDPIDASNAMSTYRLEKLVKQAQQKGVVFNFVMRDKNLGYYTGVFLKSLPNHNTLPGFFESKQDGIQHISVNPERISATINKRANESDVPLHAQVAFSLPIIPRPKVAITVLNQEQTRTSEPFKALVSFLQACVELDQTKLRSFATDDYFQEDDAARKTMGDESYKYFCQSRLDTNFDGIKETRVRGNEARIIFGDNLTAWDKLVRENGKWKLDVK